MSELKPCIRCGGHMSWNDNEFESAYVCDDCHYFIEWDGTPEEFVKWWNTRPIEDALNARIAELEALVVSLGDALTATYNSLPTHWRDHYHCPYSYTGLMLEIKKLKVKEGA